MSWRVNIGSWLVLSCLLVPAVAFGEVTQVRSTGDGSAYTLHMANEGVHPLAVSLGARGPEPARRVDVALPGHSTRDILVQCVASHDDAVPSLGVQVAARFTALQVPPLAFPDGAPALWISSRRQGRAALEKRLKLSRLEHVPLGESPRDFAALRFAALVLIELPDWLALDDAQRRAIRDAVAAGVTLVLGVAEGGSEASLEGLSPVRLGPQVQPGHTLTVHLSRVSRRRVLKPGTSWVRVKDDGGAPIMVAHGLGLGEVRVVGVRFQELDRGPLADALTADGTGALTQALAWLGRAPLALEVRHAPFSASLWWLVVALPLLGLLGRWLPRSAMALGAGVLLLGATVRPVDGVVRAEFTRTLYVPFQGGAVAVGTLDLQLRKGGGRVIKAGDHPVSIDAAEPGGACVVVGETRHWFLQGAAGSRRRLTFFAVVDDPGAGTGEALFPAWPGGPLSGGKLEKVRGALPLGTEPELSEGWRVVPSAQSATHPVVLKP